jgi:hypothetical protein
MAAFQDLRQRIDHLIEEYNVALGDFYVKREQTDARLEELEQRLSTVLRLPELLVPIRSRIGEGKDSLSYSDKYVEVVRKKATN